MVLPAQWYVYVVGVVVLHVVKNHGWEAVKKVIEHRACHHIYNGCVWVGRMALRGFRKKVWPLILMVLEGRELVLLRLPEPLRVTEVDPWELLIRFQEYKAARSRFR